MRLNETCKEALAAQQLVAMRGSLYDTTGVPPEQLVDDGTGVLRRMRAAEILDAARRGCLERIARGIDHAVVMQLTRHDYYGDQPWLPMDDVFCAYAQADFVETPYMQRYLMDPRNLRGLARAVWSALTDPKSEYYMETVRLAPLMYSALEPSAYEADAMREAAAGGNADALWTLRQRDDVAMCMAIRVRVQLDAATLMDTY